MTPRDTTLSVRAEEVRLSPASSGTPWTRLLAAEAHGAAWRLIEASSRAPFDLELSWSAGDGSGTQARVSVATATRIAVFARHLEVRGRARTEARVALHVADGFAPTRNVWVTTLGALDAAPVPPFACSVVAQVPLQSTDAVLVLDGPDGVLAEVRVGALTAPLPVAGATQVRVRGTSSARLCFHLCL